MSWPIETQTFELPPLSESRFIGNTVRGKGTLTPNNVVMAYPKISNVAHEFAIQLQFGTKFEVIEFLAGQQITLSHRMAEEHAEM